MPESAEIINAMREVTDTLQISSEQQSEVGPARAGKDTKDMMTVAYILQQRNPLTVHSLAPLSYFLGLHPNHFPFI